MTHNVNKEDMPDMTYDEIVAWHEQYPSIRMKANNLTYILWENGQFMGVGDFYHKQHDGTFKYSHSVDYENPHEYPETVSGDSPPPPNPEEDGYMPPDLGENVEPSPTEVSDEPAP
jgi:hypothetical protein